MGHQKDREEFIVRVVAQGAAGSVPHARMRVARLIMRHATTYGRLQEEACNRELTTREKIRERLIAARLAALASSIGVGLRMGGDPRGYTVKVLFPDRSVYNTMGGASEGWGVPGS